MKNLGGNNTLTKNPSKKNLNGRGLGIVYEKSMKKKETDNNSKTTKETSVGKNTSKLNTSNLNTSMTQTNLKTESNNTLTNKTLVTQKSVKKLSNNKSTKNLGIIKTPNNPSQLKKPNKDHNMTKINIANLNDVNKAVDNSKNTPNTTRPNKSEKITFGNKTAPSTNERLSEKDLKNSINNTKIINKPLDSKLDSTQKPLNGVKNNNTNQVDTNLDNSKPSLTDNIQINQKTENNEEEKKEVKALNDPDPDISKILALNASLKLNDYQLLTNLTSEIKKEIKKTTLISIFEKKKCIVFNITQYLIVYFTNFRFLTPEDKRKFIFLNKFIGKLYAEDVIRTLKTDIVSIEEKLKPILAVLFLILNLFKFKRNQITKIQLSHLLCRKVP